MTTPRSLWALLLFSALAGCGGGGGAGNSNPAGNAAPTANAGADKSAVSGTVVGLPGSGTDPDGTVASFAWAQIGAPAVVLSNANTATASFTAPNVAANTPLTFRLTVTDNTGATDTDDIVVTVTPPANPPPVVNAGANKNAASGSAVSLPGTATDSNGTVVSFAWSQVGGPAVALSNANTSTAGFTAPNVAANTPLTFRLTATDNGGATGSDDIVVTVNPPGNVNLSGTLTFQRVLHNTSTSALRYDNQRNDPIRFVTVQAIDNGTQAVLATASTDNTGHYVLNVPPNTQMFIRVRAEMVKAGGGATWDFRVVDNTNANALYTVASTVFNSGAANSVHDLGAPSGFSGTGTVTNAMRPAAPFAILDSVAQAFNKVLGADATAVFAPLVIGWSPNNSAAGGPTGTQACAINGHIGTSFYTDGNICILGSLNNDTDEYDDHVLIHEWGHYFEDKFSRSDSIGGAHGGGDRLDMRVAFGEGWGNALSGIVTDDPFYRDSNGTNQASGFAINVEANSGANPGWFSENSVQSILYDLYDNVADGPDTVALGFGPIYQVLSSPQYRSGVPLTSIFAFASRLKATQPAAAAGISAIVSGQSIVGSTIDAFGSTETNNAGSANVLPVYTAYTVNAAAVNLCSIGTFGDSNKLSDRRFIRFTVTNAGVHTFTASGGDGVLILHQAGQLGNAHDLSNPPTETFSQNLTAGDYVLELAEFANVDGDDTNDFTSCFNVTISR